MSGSVIEKLSFVSSIVTLLAFGLTLWQLRAVRRSLDAARQAAGETARRAAVQHALVLYNRLQQADHALAWGVVDGHRRAVLSHLEALIIDGSDLSGTLEWLGKNDNVPLIEEMSRSARAARQVLTAEDANLGPVTEETRARATEAIAAVSRLAASLRSEARPEALI